MFTDLTSKWPRILDFSKGVKPKEIELLFELLSNVEIEHRSLIARFSQKTACCGGHFNLCKWALWFVRFHNAESLWMVTMTTTITDQYQLITISDGVGVDLILRCKYWITIVESILQSTCHDLCCFYWFSPYFCRFGKDFLPFIEICVFLNFLKLGYLVESPKRAFFHYFGNLNFSNSGMDKAFRSLLIILEWMLMVSSLGLSLCGNFIPLLQHRYIALSSALN